MNRIFIVCLLILSLVIATIYIFIPHKLIISKATYISANPEAVSRIIIQTNKWQQQFNEHGIKSLPDSGDNYFVYKNDTFRVKVRHHNSLDIMIADNGTEMNSNLGILPVTPDSVALQWQAELSAGNNLFSKIKQYKQAVRVKQHMVEILDQLKRYLRRDENVYGLKIGKSSTADTFLIATKLAFTNYPSTAEIYSLINKLKLQALKKGALQTNAPMVNVTKDSNQYLVMVAMPVNQKLSDDGNVFYRRMVPGKFLVADVTGGNRTILNAIDNMKLYLSDYRITSMAIPFQSLITDRSKVPDSSKWITRIYYPINY